MVSPQFQSPTMYINQSNYQNQFQSPYQMLNPASQLQCPPFQPSSSPYYHQSFAVYQNPASANTSCLPVATKSTAPVLPSSTINTAKLVPVMQTIAEFPKLQTESRESRVSVLVVKLARESFFGKDVLSCFTN